MTKYSFQGLLTHLGKRYRVPVRLLQETIGTVDFSLGELPYHIAYADGWWRTSVIPNPDFLPVLILDLPSRELSTQLGIAFGHYFSVVVANSVERWVDKREAELTK